MSAQEQIRLLNMVIETQASRIADQEATIKELRIMVDELRSSRQWPSCVRKQAQAPLSHP